jgi:hypothetical protein
MPASSRASASRSVIDPSTMRSFGDRDAVARLARVPRRKLSNTTTSATGSVTS